MCVFEGTVSKLVSYVSWESKKANGNHNLWLVLVL